MRFYLFLFIVALADFALAKALDRGLIKPMVRPVHGEYRRGELELTSSYREKLKFPCAPVENVSRGSATLSGGCRETDARGLSRFRPNSECVYSFPNGTEGTGATIRFDGRGRRFVPSSGGEANHVLVLGCSVAFGLGLPDEQSLAAYLGRELQSTRAFLAAAPASGPNDIYAHLPEYLSDMALTPGTAVYVGIGSHIERFVGTFSHIGTYAENKAALRENSPGHFSVLGPWKTAYPWRTQIAKILMQSGFIRYTALDFPFVLNQDLQRYVRLIGAIKNQYTGKFPDGRFVYVFAVGSARHYNNQLKSHLDRAKIEYLDYSELCPSALLGPEPASIPGEGHPSAALFREWAKIIAQDLSGSRQ